MRALCCLVATCVISSAADWPRFRGANGTGVSDEKGFPASLDPAKSLVWKTATIKGNSSPVVIGNRIFFTGHEGDERVTLCYDAAKGTLLWRKGFAKPRSEGMHPLNGPTTPTPVTDGKSVFAFFPEFGVIAYDVDGMELWRAPLGPFPSSIQGIASSPALADRKVIVLVDTAAEAYVVALDAKTGEQSWKVQRPTSFLGGYATPSVYKPDSGPEQVIVSGGMELTAYQARTGERLWWAPVTFAPASLPLIAGGHVYTMEPAAEGAPPFTQMLEQYDKDGNGKIEVDGITGTDPNSQIMKRLFTSIDKAVGNGDGVVTADEFNRSFSSDRPGGLVQTRLGGKGDVSKTHVGWRYTKGIPYVTAPIVYEGVLYVVRDGGILQCFDPGTGKLLREERFKDAPGAYYASPVAADGKIYFVSHAGKVTVIKAGAQWEIVGSADLDEEVIGTPALAGGRVYVRSAKSLYCFANKG